MTIYLQGGFSAGFRALKPFDIHNKGR